MKRFGSIYIITNKLTGKIYIGQTIMSVKHRWKAHRNSNKSLIGRSIKKYGVSNFSFQELLVCFDQDSLNFYETYYIKLFNTIRPDGYNLMTGGNERTFSAEVKLKMKLAKLGKPSKNHIIGIIAKNVDTGEMKEYESLKTACIDLQISRSSILKSVKYNLVRKGFKFFYANQSGSTEDKNSGHAQRLGFEPDNSEYKNPTSPRFPSKYLDKKETILNLYHNGNTAHSISRILKLDKSMVSYFINVFGK